MHAKDLYDRLAAGYNYDPMYGELCNERDGLKIENVKLREFVYDMWNDMNVYYTQHEGPDSGDMDFYRNSMRGLGIEVDE